MANSRFFVVVASALVTEFPTLGTQGGVLFRFDPDGRASAWTAQPGANGSVRLTPRDDIASIYNAPHTLEGLDGSAAQEKNIEDFFNPNGPPLHADALIGATFEDDVYASEGQVYNRRYRDATDTLFFGNDNGSVLRFDPGQAPKRFGGRGLELSKSLLPCSLLSPGGALLSGYRPIHPRELMNMATGVLMGVLDSQVLEGSTINGEIVPPLSQATDEAPEQTETPATDSPPPAADGILKMLEAVLG